MVEVDKEDRAASSRMTKEDLFQEVTFELRPELSEWSNVLKYNGRAFYSNYNEKPLEDFIIGVI